MRHAVYFVQIGCPVCERTDWMLARLESDGFLHVTTVDIDMNPANEYMDFYNYFCRYLGARHVPVIVLGWPSREIMMVPKYFTVVGRPGEVVGGPIEGLDKQVAELSRMIRRKLREMEDEPVPYPTHELLLQRWR